MTETRFAVRVPHTMRAWYVLMDFPDGTTELMVIVGAYYNYNNLVDLLCGIYDLTFEERKEVMKQWSFDVMFND